MSYFLRSFIKQQILFLMIAFFAVFLSRIVNNDLSFAFNIQNSLLYSFIQYFISVLIVFSFINLIYFCVRKLKLSLFIFTSILILLNFINIKKQEYLSASFTPTDFLLFKETLISAPILLLISTAISIFSFGCIIYFISKKEVITKSKSIYFNLAIPLVVLSLFIFMNSQENFSAYCEKLETSSKSCILASAIPKTRNNWIGDHEAIKTYGFLTFFLSKSLDNFFVQKSSSHITEHQISSLYEKNNLPTNLSPPELPNIIFVMSESHWDATRLDQSIPKDITPTINKHQVSSVLSPSFGGGTANVEFEVLTSLNTFLNHNELAYTSKLDRPTYSLASYLNSIGYNSTAMHNNGKYFYNRSTVYHNLGFHRFISIENMISLKERSKYINQAGWATDDLLYNSIREQLKNTDQPQFIYAISVENHPMYSDDRFGKDHFKITKEGISDSTKQALNTYLTGMQRADEKFKGLIEDVKQLDRPTIIVFFGDHLPNLQQVYDEYGFFASTQEKAEKKDVKFFETPLAVWANFPIERKTLQEPFIPAHFLAPRILSAANIPLSPYYSFIQHVNSCYKTVHQTGIQPQKSCDTPTDLVLQQYKDMNMDVLNGKNFTYKILEPKAEI